MGDVSNLVFRQKYLVGRGFYVNFVGRKQILISNESRYEVYQDSFVVSRVSCTRQLWHDINGAYYGPDTYVVGQ